MEVSYTTTLDDFVALNLHTLKRSPTMRWQSRLAWVFLPLGCLIWSALLINANFELAIAIGFGGIAYAVAYPFIYRSAVRRTVQTYARDFGLRGMIGPISLVLTDETLTEQTESVQSVVRWQDMKGMEIVGECTYIYVTGLSTAIIPRRGFECHADYEAVRDFAIAKLGSPT